jgi:hypothetical protein
MNSPDWRAHAHTSFCGKKANKLKSQRMLSTPSHALRSTQSNSSIASKEDDYATDEESVVASLQDSTAPSTHSPPIHLFFHPNAVRERMRRHRRAPLDMWGNVSVNQRFECGAFVFDESPDSVSCRVHVERNIATFQSTKEGESSNAVQIRDVKIYVNRYPGRSDYLVIGLMFTPSCISLVINGIMIEIKQQEHYGFFFTRKAVNPAELPLDLKIKVVPVSFSYNYVFQARQAVHNAVSIVSLHTPSPFKTCHVIFDTIVRAVSDNMLQIEADMVSPDEALVGDQECYYYKSMKIIKGPLGRRFLCKKHFYLPQRFTCT